MKMTLKNSLLFIIAISLFLVTLLFLTKEYDSFKNLYHGFNGFDEYVEYVGASVLTQSYLLNFVVYPLTGTLIFKHLFKKK